MELRWLGDDTSLGFAIILVVFIAIRLVCDGITEFLSGIDGIGVTSDRVTLAGAISALFDGGLLAVFVTINIVRRIAITSGGFEAEGKFGKAAGVVAFDSARLFGATVSPAGGEITAIACGVAVAVGVGFALEGVTGGGGGGSDVATDAVYIILTVWVTADRSTIDVTLRVRVAV